MRPSSASFNLINDRLRPCLCFGIIRNVGNKFLSSGHSLKTIVAKPTRWRSMITQRALLMEPHGNSPKADRPERNRQSQHFGCAPGGGPLADIERIIGPFEVRKVRMIGGKIRPRIGCRHIYDLAHPQVSKDAVMPFASAALGEQAKEEEDVADANRLITQMPLCSPRLTKGNAPIMEKGIVMAQRLWIAHMITKSDGVVGYAPAFAAPDGYWQADGTAIDDGGRATARSGIEAFAADDQLHRWAIPLRCAMAKLCEAPTHGKRATTA